MDEVFGLSGMNGLVNSTLEVDYYKFDKSGLLTPRRILSLTSVGSNPALGVLVSAFGNQGDKWSSFPVDTETVARAVTGFCVGKSGYGFELPDQNISLIPENLRVRLPDHLKFVIDRSLNPPSIGQYL